jgi:SAM-dependent methyltransferase
LDHTRHRGITIEIGRSLHGTTEYWDERASSFDDEPDHGLTNERVRSAWSRRLAEWLPELPSTVVDLGCGTGSLAVLVAEAGHEVVGVDLSPAMLEQAQIKAHAASRSIRFVVGDAADPALAAGTFDVVLARHVIWALADPDEALRRWADLLKPDGRLVAVEGQWGDGGIAAIDLMASLTPLFNQIEHYPLSGDPDLWGTSVDDERYAVVATGSRTGKQ